MEVWIVTSQSEELKEKVTASPKFQLPSPNIWHYWNVNVTFTLITVFVGWTLLHLNLVTHWMRQFCFCGFRSVWTCKPHISTVTVTSWLWEVEGTRTTSHYCRLYKMIIKDVNNLSFICAEWHFKEQRAMKTMKNEEECKTNDEVKWKSLSSLTFKQWTMNKHKK